MWNKVHDTFQNQSLEKMNKINIWTTTQSFPMFLPMLSSLVLYTLSSQRTAVKFVSLKCYSFDSYPILISSGNSTKIAKEHSQSLFSGISIVYITSNFISPCLSNMVTTQQHWPMTCWQGVWIQSYPCKLVT